MPLNTDNISMWDSLMNISCEDLFSLPMVLTFSDQHIANVKEMINNLFVSKIWFANKYRSVWSR